MNSIFRLTNCRDNILAGVETWDKRFSFFFFFSFFHDSPVQKQERRKRQELRFSGTYIVIITASNLFSADNRASPEGACLMTLVKCLKEILSFLSIFFFFLLFKRKGMAKLGNIFSETLLRTQMFPNLATYGTLLRMLQGRKSCILNTCFLV